ncbi:MAG: hypothetical protein K2J67_05610 [Lachnospiraceae bacterium]|nr:hypothetical protein [Lachnospiraceae bacterium]
MGTKYIDQEQLAVNRKYKDTLFRMIFREKRNLLQLYNALNNTNYTVETDLEVVTLENAIYMNMKNDVAFLLADRLNLYEHQSTYNPNMPLRDLFYICREYEKIVRQEDLYRRKKLQIPNPRFIVFYNGIDWQEEYQILKLSDLYLHQEEHPELELKVFILNINRGYNNAIMEQCRLLSEYMQYVDKVRNHSKTMPIQIAVEQAVTESIRQGILSDFLSKFRREAIQMSIFEYHEEETLRLIRQDERQEGIEESIRNLMETMKLNLSQAMDALKIPTEDRSMYAARIQKQ